MDIGGETAAVAPSVTNAYRSRFGGLWVDRLDAEAELDRRLATRRITANDAEMVWFWMRNGYVIIPQAVSAGAIDAFARDVDRAWLRGDTRLKVAKRPGEYYPMTPDLRNSRLRVVDFYAYWPSALPLMFADPIVHFLKLIFDCPPLGFQSLSFEDGSQQFIHQDTAFVVVSSPMKLTAAWVALEDIQEGSGELVYYEGSHKLEEFIFGGETKHWDPQRDGDAVLQEYGRSLIARAEGQGLSLRTFRPRKGDALIWSADLAHGGSAIAHPERTRRSLVTHYCPQDVEPYYFSYQPEHRRRRKYKDCEFSSQHYLLPEEPPRLSWARRVAAYFRRDAIEGTGR